MIFHIPEEFPVILNCIEENGEKDNTINYFIDYDPTTSAVSMISKDYSTPLSVSTLSYKDIQYKEGNNIDTDIKKEIIDFYYNVCKEKENVYVDEGSSLILISKILMTGNIMMVNNNVPNVILLHEKFDVLFGPNNGNVFVNRGCKFLNGIRLVFHDYEEYENNIFVISVYDKPERASYNLVCNDYLFGERRLKILRIMNDKVKYNYNIFSIGKKPENSIEMLTIKYN